MHEHFRFPRLYRSLIIAPAAIWLTILALAPASAAPQYKFKLLHTFCKALNCTDGAIPNGGVLRDSAGNLYGVTEFGGKYNGGVAFKLAPNGKGWSYYVIHSFSANAIPNGELIMDSAGNLYGATANGGAHGRGGEIFKLTHGQKGWGLTRLYSFCSDEHCLNGRLATGSLTYAGKETGALYDGHSALFGVTTNGGQYDNGIAFSLTYIASAWQLKVLHVFDTGINPNPPLADSAGNLYGTVRVGGKYGSGLMYKLSQSENWKESILKNFCAQKSCADGELPAGALVPDGAGNLFGATLGGGIDHGGVAFERTPGNAYKIIYKFCTILIGSYCSDGFSPQAGFVMDSSGRLFGTTFQGGDTDQGCSDQSGCGAAFELTKDGGGNWSETVIHSFCDCNDGANPAAPLAIDSAGDLFGTTTQGGADFDGTVFELIP